ncbi:hypothetical protein ACTWQL_03695 [Pseudalkalibacillus sp. R45]|uniref:hypothetical protein n=1 Tax=Pseudalkalibacillus sp. R45 TaxID=3457433 RepID=UPI003FCE1886
MKKLLMVFMSLLLVIGVAGCQSDSDENTADEPGTSDEGQTEKDTDEKSEDEKSQDTNSNDESADEDSSKDEKAEEDMITVIGSYNGQADSHTIEVETTDGPQAFQITEEVAAEIQDYKVGDKIVFKYKEINGQKVIMSLDKK